MLVKTVKTRVLRPPQDDLLDAMKKSLPKLKEGSVVAVTSKVVSIWQGRCVSAKKYPDRDKLIAEEADEYLPRKFVLARGASNRSRTISSFHRRGSTRATRTITIFCGHGIPRALRKKFGSGSGKPIT